MAEVSYRLGQYQIIERDDGELWWKSHGGFASVRTGKCFIEGDILFIGQAEAEEAWAIKERISSAILASCRSGQRLDTTAQATL